MSDEYQHELFANEIAAMHFGFSPRGFTDQIYNCAVDAWAQTVEDVLLKDPFIKPAANNKKLRMGLMDLFFTTGGNAFNKVVAEFTHYVSRYIFRIPDSVTLPIHVYNQQLDAEQMKNEKLYSFSAEEKRAKAAEQDIAVKKHALAEVELRIRDADKTLLLMKTMLAILKERDDNQKITTEIN